MASSPAPPTHPRRVGSPAAAADSRTSEEADDPGRRHNRPYLGVREIGVNHWNLGCKLSGIYSMKRLRLIAFGRSLSASIHPTPLAALRTLTNAIYPLATLSRFARLSKR